jgi:hypothetical protein
MEYPIELVSNVPLKLGAYQAFFRGKHVMIIRITGAGGIEKPDFSFTHIFRVYPELRKKDMETPDPPGNGKKLLRSHCLNPPNNID